MAGTPSPAAWEACLIHVQGIGSHSRSGERSKKPALNYSEQPRPPRMLEISNILFTHYAIFVVAVKLLWGGDVGWLPRARALCL